MMENLIRAAVDKGAATLHIKAGDVFRARIKADLVKLSEEPFTDEEVHNLALTLLPDQALRDRIGEITDHDFAWELPDVARFRVNILRQRGSFMIVMRVIPWEVPGFEELGRSTSSPSRIRSSTGTRTSRAPSLSVRSSTTPSRFGPG
jgi:twitching motility protein PilT